MRSASSRIALGLARWALQLLIWLCWATFLLYVVIATVPVWLQSSTCRALIDAAMFPFMPLALNAYPKSGKYSSAVRTAICFRVQPSLLKVQVPVA